MLTWSVEFIMSAQQSPPLWRIELGLLPNGAHVRTVDDEESATCGLSGPGAHVEGRMRSKRAKYPPPRNSAPRRRSRAAAPKSRTYFSSST